MTKKTYHVDYDMTASVDIEIDHNPKTDALLVLINDFWTGAEERVSNSGSVLNAVLRMLAAECLRLEFFQGMGTNLVIRAFEHEMEGWPKMDGSAGIKIIAINGFNIDVEQMFIEEVTRDDDH